MASRCGSGERYYKKNKQQHSSSKSMIAMTMVLSEVVLLDADPVSRQSYSLRKTMRSMPDHGRRMIRSLRKQPPVIICRQYLVVFNYYFKPFYSHDAVYSTGTPSPTSLLRHHSSVIRRACGTVASRGIGTVHQFPFLKLLMSQSMAVTFLYIRV